MAEESTSITSSEEALSYALNALKSIRSIIAVTLLGTIAIGAALDRKERRSLGSQSAIAAFAQNEVEKISAVMNSGKELEPKHIETAIDLLTIHSDSVPVFLRHKVADMIGKADFNQLVRYTQCATDTLNPLTGENSVTLSSKSRLDIMANPIVRRLKTLIRNEEATLDDFISTLQSKGVPPEHIALLQQTFDMPLNKPSIDGDRTLARS